MVFHGFLDIHGCVVRRGAGEAKEIHGGGMKR